MGGDAPGSVAGLLARIAARGIDTGRPRRPGEVVFNVSDLVDCPAQAIARELGVEADPVLDVYGRYIMELGAVFHSALQAELGLVNGYTSEVPVEEALTVDGVTVRVIGRADIVSRDAVVEVKVSAGLGKVKEDGPRLAAWLLQLLYYAKLLGKGRAYLLVFDRCQPRVAVAEVDPGKVAEAGERAARVIRSRAVAAARALLKGSPWDVAAPGPWCRYCPFRRRCPAIGAAPTASSLLGIAPGKGLTVTEYRP